MNQRDKILNNKEDLTETANIKKTEQDSCNAQSLQEKKNQPDAPGEILALTRKSKGLTIKDISEALHLLPLYVESLEAGNYKKIPSAAFVKGYMRSYATYLNLDADDLIARLPSEYQLERVFAKDSSSDSSKGVAKIQKVAFLLISFGFIIGLLGLTIYWWQLRGENTQNTSGAYDVKIEETQDKADVLIPIKDPNQIAEEEPEQQATVEELADVSVTDELGSSLQEVEPETQVPVEIQKPQEAKPKPKTSARALAKLANPENIDLNALSALDGGTFVLTFVGECWLQARDADGAELISTTANAGELIKIAGKKPIKLILGKGRNARAHYKNAPFDLERYTGEEVARLTIR